MNTDLEREEQMGKLYCDNYMGDFRYHLYVYCMRKGIVTALQCTECEYRKISDARVDAKKEFIIKENKNGKSDV